jgi:probable phosphoglycerate mutase
MTRLALLRHGHTSWNRAGRIQGRSDIPLDDDARQILADLCLPSPWQQAELWSSPLTRAYETATLVADRDPRTSPALTEMNWGAWEGLHGSDLRADPDSGFATSRTGDGITAPQRVKARKRSGIGLNRGWPI